MSALPDGHGWVFSRNLEQGYVLHGFAFSEILSKIRRHVPRVLMR